MKPEMTLSAIGSRYVPRTVGAAAEAVLNARGDSRRVTAIFDGSRVPLVMVDRQRRFVDANSPARLVFRLSIDELRMHAIDDFTPADLAGVRERQWARLLDTGCVAGPYRVAWPDGSRLDVVYCGLANILPGLHVIALAPADWPEDELGAIEHNGGERSTSLTPREIEVLALAANGLDSRELAHELVVSRTTIHTHFRNIFTKLEVRNRAGAVAKAMRLGVID
jgi:DNA-binding CsgD family transcriptional regulator